MSSPKVPLCLVTGFLGAGKTTLLEQIVEQLRGRRVLFLVNEFAPKDVDGTRLDLPEGQLKTVAGGSIFCKCKVTDFIAVLTQAVDDRPEGVVIEASGIADPRVTGRMLEETGLQRDMHLARCVCVVDPGSFPKLLKTLPNVVAQVRTADLVIVNKIDKHDDAAIAWCEEQVRELHPGVAIERADHCRVVADWLPDSSVETVAGDYAKCRDPNYVSVVARPAGPVDLARLQTACDALGDELYRVKGAAPTPAGVVDIDRSVSGWTSRPARDDDHQLVLIGAGAASERLTRLAADIQRGLFTAGEAAAS